MFSETHTHVTRVKMNHWCQLVIFFVIIGLVKGAHFIKVVILAGLGLAGLWMVNNLAQNFNGGQNNVGPGGGGGGRDFFKRSVDSGRVPMIDWETVLSRDPAGCARSFLCQLSATDKELLSEEEQRILRLVRRSSREETNPSKQLTEALKNGENMEKPSHCMKIYKLCPYTSQTMTTLLRIFG